MDNSTASDLAERRDRFFATGSPFAPVSRGEIVGIDAVVERADEIAGYLSNAAEYARHGARLEPGVVFHGPPGTGKTLVARYLATTCDALFVNVRDVPRESARIGAADVADIFSRAREHYAATGRPVLLFWDEFDEQTSHGHESQRPEAEDVLFQLRAELDGVAGKAEGVFLVGCANYCVDGALVRPGRMSRLLFNAPDLAGKALLLDRALGAVATGGDVDTLWLAELFPSGAPASEVAEAVTDAWFHATKRAVASGAEPLLTEEDVRDVLVGRAIGTPPPWGEPHGSEPLRTAVHEIGHALVALAHDLQVVLVTVRPGSIGPGMVMLGDNPLVTVADHIARMAVSFGSTAAEQCAGLGVGLGNAEDTARATKLASGVVDHNGIGERSGPFSPRPLQRGPHGGRGVSEEMLERLDLDARDFLEEARERAEDIVNAVGRELLLELAALLIERETFLRDEIESLLLPALADERAVA